MSLETWHSVHDEHVALHGDGERPEAVRLADADALAWEPGAVWRVSDPGNVTPMNYTQVVLAHWNARGMLYSGAAKRDLEGA